VDYFFNNLSYVSECIALLIGTILFLIHKSKKLAILLALLILVVAAETIGKFNPIPILSGSSKLILGNAILWIEITLFFLIYYLLIQNERRKKLVLFMAIAHSLFCLINHFTLQPFDLGYASHSFVFGSIGLQICIILYFFESINKNPTELFRDFWIWISIGLFVFLSSEIPIMSILNYLSSKPNMISTIKPILILKYFFSSIYYLMYLIGFLCMKTK